jgi:chitodextrinase
LRMRNKARRLITMMLVFSMVLFLAVPFASAEPVVTGEVLLNPNFEEFDAATLKPLHWQVTDGVISTDEYRRHGTRSLKFTSSDLASRLSAEQTVEVFDKHIYKLRGFFHDAMGSNPDRVSEVIAHSLDAAGNVLSSEVLYRFDANNTNTAVYKEFIKEFVTPEGATHVTLEMYGTNYTGFFLYDWFQMSLIGAAPVVVPLTAPTDVTITSAKHSSISLSWTASEGVVEGYRILRDGTEVGNVTGTIFTDTELAASTTYNYVVEAYNADESAASASVAGTTASGPVVSGEVLLNPNFEEYDPATLKPLFWETTDGVISTDEFRRHGTRSLKFTSSDLASRLSAEQTVSVFDRHIYKLRGFFHNAMGSNPDRVSEVVAHSIGNDGAVISSEVLYRFDANNTNTAVYKEFIKEFTTPEGTSEVTIEMYGTNYTGFFLYDWFQMSLIGAAPDTPTVPDAPTKVNAVVTSSTEVELSWSIPAGNINGYNIYRDGALIGASATNSYSDSGLTPDQEYSYTVTALNDVGESAHSAAVVVLMDFFEDTTPPTKPVLRADAESSTKIVLRWKGVDDDVRVADHEIYRNGQLLTDNGIIMGVYEDKNLTPGTTYTYAVIARDDAGNKSEISNTAVATTFDDAVSDYVEGMVQLNYYINEANADVIYRLGPGYAGETGLTASAVVDLPGDAADAVYTQPITDTTKTVISIPISDLAVGEYPVALSILDGDQIIWATADSIIKNPPATGDTRVTQVDHDREILLVDGAPYYPLGAFGVDEDSLQQLADAGFNTTLRWKGYTTWPSYNMELSPDDPYNVGVVSSYLDAVQAAGLYAFESPVKLAEEKYYHNYKDPNWDSKYPIHNEIITPGVLHTAATHPAVVGYYSYDEVDNFYECCPTQSDHVVMQHGVEEWYDIVKELDPYHSVMTLFAVGVSKNADWSAWDIVARDYYLNDTKHMSDIYKYMKESAITADEWNDPFIATPLLEESSAQRKPINGIQQRANTYSSVIAGARGLYYWDWAAVYNDNWDMLKQLMGEVNQLQPILTERIPLQNIAYADGTAHQYTSAKWTGMSKSAQALVTNHADKTYLITVNTENAPIEVTFTLPAEHSGTGTVWFEGREIEVVNGTFTDTFEPYGRHVYELQGTWVEGKTITLDVSITGAETVYVDPVYATATKNMIKNSSFEESYGSTPGIPAHWFNGDSPMNSGQSGPDGEWHVDDDVSFHGESSMRLTEKEGGVFDDIFMFQVPGIFQGGLEYRSAGTYTYSVWMKADRPDVTVTLQESWSTFENVEVGTEWARYEVQINKNGAGGGFAALWVMDQGTVWVDAIQMELANTATDYEAPVLTNPDTYTGSVESKPPVVAPTELTAVASNRSVELSWTASVGDIAIASYEVSRNGEVVGTTDTTSYTDTGLERGTEYSYTVKAVNVEGDISQPTEALVVTTLDQPNAPSGLAAVAVSSSEVNLSWTASTDDVVGYMIFRDGVAIGLSESTDYSDTGLAAETTYTYSVKAIEATGTLSASSDAAAVTTLVHVSYETIADQIAAYTASGDLSNSVSKQLENKLKQAKAFGEAGNTQQEDKFLNDMLDALNNNGQQKNISAEAKAELTAAINLLIQQ